MNYNAAMEIVAEIGSVHDGSFGNALHLIDTANSVGATIVKFQHHLASAEMTPNAPAPSYFNFENRFEYFERISFTDLQWKRLIAHCKYAGVKFGCSVFSFESLHKMIDFDIDALKIPSGELSNTPLLELIAETMEGSKTQVFLSTGMSDWKEIESAFETLKHLNLSLFQCTSLYPTSPEKIGLNVIGEMLEKFQVPVGLSDHSKGTELAIAAVALGASLIEKHLTFSRQMYGSDAFNALEPEEFKTMSRQINNVRAAIQNPVDKNNLEDLMEMRQIFQKGIYLKIDLKNGETIKMEDLAFLKPDVAIPSSMHRVVIGKSLNKNKVAGSILTWSDLEE